MVSEPTHDTQAVDTASSAASGRLKVMLSKRHAKKKQAGKWEGSKQDNAMDKKMAKKAGVSMKSWEGSKEDEAMDQQMEKKMNGKGGKRY